MTSIDAAFESESEAALTTLKLLADDTRWRLLSELRHSDRQVSELVARLSLPQNLISYHLGLLRQAGLVRTHRSDADARALYYGLDLATLRRNCNTINGCLALCSTTEAALTAPDTTVVFLGTGNLVRSQIAEGWLRYLGGSRVRVRSAGIHPRNLHPQTIAVMDEVGVDIGYQYTKGTNALAELQVDVLITICDLAREDCPTWLNQTPYIFHWSIGDPMMVIGDSETIAAAFRSVRDDIRTRVEGLIALLPSLVKQPAEVKMREVSMGDEPH